LSASSAQGVNHAGDVVESGVSFFRNHAIKGALRNFRSRGKLAFVHNLQVATQNFLKSIRVTRSMDFCLGFDVWLFSDWLSFKFKLSISNLISQKDTLAKYVHYRVQLTCAKADK
jgi:hypothetical protein